MNMMTIRSYRQKAAAGDLFIHLSFIVIRALYFQTTCTGLLTFQTEAKRNTFFHKITFHVTLNDRNSKQDSHNDNRMTVDCFLIYLNLNFAWKYPVFCSVVTMSSMNVLHFAWLVSKYFSRVNNM